MKKKSVWPALSCVCAAVSMGVFSAFAAEIEWCGADGAAWGEPTSWTGGEVPTAADTAVFDPGADTTLNVTLNAIQDVGGVKVLSGTVVLGEQDVAKKYLRMNADADGISEVAVVGGAYLRVNCGMLPAEPNLTVFKKTGSGTIGFYGPFGDPNEWIKAYTRQGFGQIDLAGGVFETLKNGNITYATNILVRAGTLWHTQHYNTMMYGSPYLYLEKGGLFCTYDQNDRFGAVEGEGRLDGHFTVNDKGVTNHNGTCSITLERGPCRFDGRLGSVTADVGAYKVVFGAQGEKSDADYSFVVGNTNVLSGLAAIGYADEPSPRAVTNCPIRFAAGVSRFNFFVLNCKKDAPLVLEDVSGAPVDVYATNLGDNNGAYANSQLFAVSGRGDFYVRHSPGGWRRWEIPFTNGCFRSTGAVGSYDDGVATFGDGTEGHDPDLSTVSRLVAKDAKSKVSLKNFGALTVPGLEINGTFTQNAGAGDLTVSGAATGSGTYTLDAPTTFDGPVEITGTMVINTNVTYNGSVSGGQFTVKAETAFNGPVEGGKFVINKSATFADEVKGGTYTISAATKFEGPVRGSTFTISAPTEFAGETEMRGTFEVNAPTKVVKLVTGEDNVLAVKMGKDLHLGTGGKEGWLSSVSGVQPKEGALVFSNGFFHAAYEKDDYTKLDIWRPGHFVITHPVVRIVDADVRVAFYNSAFSDLTVGPGGVVYQYSNASQLSGSITLDGGEYRVYLRQSFGHDAIPRDTIDDWTFLVTERGGRISDYAWRTRGGDNVRPNVTAAFASGAAEGHVPGELALSFQNQITFRQPLATGGRIRIESGYVQPGETAACLEAYENGTFFGTNDLALGCMTFNFGQRNSDYKPWFAASGQKLRLEAPALLVGRVNANTAQTFTFGDGVSSPFARERGGFLVISDAKITETTHFDGTGVKAYVKGARAPVDPVTRILKDPVFGSTMVSGVYSGCDIYRLDFLTQGDDGLLKYDASVYADGVEGGATKAALVSQATNLSVNAQVAALNLDGHPLTIDEGATLKVGSDDTDYPAVVLMRCLKDTWSGSDPRGDLKGTGTLDFGASEGLIVAGRTIRIHTALCVNCRITGTGGLSIGGVSRMEDGASALDLRGDNDYTGGTRIGGTEVRLFSANALSTGPVRIAGGFYNGGRVRFCTAATYANEWFASGSGSYLYASAGLEPGCLVFNADVTLTGPVHVERVARFSTSMALDDFTTNYDDFRSGTGVFAGEISGGEVQVVSSHPAGFERKPIVFAHHNTYTGGTWVAMQDLILRGDGDCGTGKVTMGTVDATLTFENDAEKTFPSLLEGKGTVRLAGSAPVHFTGGVKRESWCDLRLDLAGTAPVLTEAPAFGTVTNSAARYATVTLRGDMTIDPASYDYLDPNVRLTVDGGTIDLAGGTLTVQRATLLKGAKFVNGTLNETKPAQGLLLIVR